uniref:Secreted protein n=1 Tax=Anopheles darlingi TaxID=43151 RepID=A0A2M4D8U3_ANODA
MLLLLLLLLLLMMVDRRSDRRSGFRVFGGSVLGWFGWLWLSSLFFNTNGRYRLVVFEHRLRTNTQTQTNTRGFNVMHHFLWIKPNISFRFTRTRRSLLSTAFDNRAATATAFRCCCCC